MILFVNAELRRAVFGSAIIVTLHFMIYQNRGTSTYFLYHKVQLDSTKDSFNDLLMTYTKSSNIKSCHFYKKFDESHIITHAFLNNGIF